MNPAPEDSRDRNSAVLFGLSFAFLLGIYVWTLAPDVTFEDSGELITAAYRVGVPHPPGYPLYTMLAHAFTWLPLGTIAYRVNLMSAFFMAIGCGLIGVSVRLVLQALWEPASGDRANRMIVFMSAWSAAVLAGLSVDVWKQAVITEVYGLHAAFVGLLSLLLLQWYFHPDRRAPYYYMIAFVSALSLTNHPTTILLAPAILLLFLLEDRKFLGVWKHHAWGSMWFVAGLLPLLYLPIASAENPVLDWGNPENLTNFWRVITRQQYDSESMRSLRAFLSQLKWYRQLLVFQWIPWILVWAVPALLVVFKRRRYLGLFLIILLMSLVPLTAWITNFDVLTGDPMVIRENKALVSVFYIPSYMIIAALIGIGLYVSSLWIPSAARVPAIVTISIVMIGWTTARNFPQADMSGHRFARAYAENLMAVAPVHAVVLTNWDPFSFPLMYFQLVENRRPDVVVVDQELMRRSWYVEWLVREHPDVAEPSGKAINDFLVAVRPFEDRKRYDEKGLETAFHGMINALIDSNEARGRDIFLMYDPDEAIAASYFKESVLTAIRLRRKMDRMTGVEEKNLRFDEFISVQAGDERFAVFFKTYYGRLHYARGYLFELQKNRQEAHRLYGQAMEFLQDNREFKPIVEEGLRRTGMQMEN